MLFPTVAFALFFCVAFLANWLLRPKLTVWRLAMIGLSFFFYGYWDKRFVMLLVTSIAINHLVARRLVANRVDGELTTGGRRILKFGIAANLGILGFFKYYGFFIASAGNALGRLGLDVEPPLLNITLPIGISFFTFQAISYIVDIGRNKFERPLPLLDLGFFLSFFPQLVAGPIVRATDMAAQITRRPDPRTIPASEAFWLIAQGLIKKVVISSYLATNLVDPVFDVPGDHSRFDVMLAIYGYAVQIYADFSGYTDIAIGCALLLGFRFPQNFNAPYRALSVREFWHRWHISLSTWLRDYLYIPLGGNRGGRLLTYRNLAITMVLGGLWHGAAWTFVAWGIVHAVALIVERLVVGRVSGRGLRPDWMSPAMVTGLRWVVTFHVICLSWVFFRADTIARAFELLGRLVSGGGPSPLLSALALAVIAGAVGAQFIPTTAIDKVRVNFAHAAPAAQATILALTLTIIDALGPEGVAPFIYFQF